MIVDLFTRIWDAPQQMGEALLEQHRRRRSAPWTELDAGEEAFQQAMTPVHNAVIHGMVSRRLGAEITVERVAELVRRDPERFVGFAGIDPLAGSPVAALERARGLGLAGVTVSPALCGFHPLHSRAMDLYEACAAKGVPVVFESGATRSRDAVLEFAQPVLIDEVLRTFPALKVVITGLGDPFLDQGMALVSKHPTVYGELSAVLHRPWRLYNALIEAYQLGVMSQLLFGSGFPAMRPDRAIVAIYSASGTAQGTNLPGVPREQLRAVVERDAFACLGLSPPHARPRALPDTVEAAPTTPTAPSPSDADASSSTSPTAPDAPGSDAAQPVPRPMQESRR